MSLAIEALIGPDTITTVPPATMDAFRDHGRVQITLGTNAEDAEAALESAAAALAYATTEQLQADALKAFTSSFDQLPGDLGGEAAPDRHGRELTRTGGRLRRSSVRHGRWRTR